MAVKERTKAALAYRLLKESVKDGTFGAGEQITEARAARKFGLGRMPVREAILKLEAEGLLRGAGPHRGKFVEYIEDVKPQAAVWRSEVREIVEGKAAASAAMNMTGLQIARLRELAAEVQRAEQDGDRERRHHYNREYHEYLMSHCGNDLLDDVWHMHHLMAFTAKSVALEAEIRASITDQEKQNYGPLQVVQAIAAHDPDLAEQRMRRSVRLITDGIRRVMQAKHGTFR